MHLSVGSPRETILSASSVLTLVQCVVKCSPTSWLEISKLYELFLDTHNVASKAYFVCMAAKLGLEMCFWATYYHNHSAVHTTIQLIQDTFTIQVRPNAQSFQSKFQIPKSNLWSVCIEKFMCQTFYFCVIVLRNLIFHASETF